MDILRKYFPSSSSRIATSRIKPNQPAADPDPDGEVAPQNESWTLAANSAGSDFAQLRSERRRSRISSIFKTFATEPQAPEPDAEPEPFKEVKPYLSNLPTELLSLICDFATAVRSDNNRKNNTYTTQLWAPHPLDGLSCANKRMRVICLPYLLKTMAMELNADVDIARVAKRVEEVSALQYIDSFGIYGAPNAIPVPSKYRTQPETEKERTKMFETCEKISLPLEREYPPIWDTIASLDHLTSLTILVADPYFSNALASSFELYKKAYLTTSHTEDFIFPNLLELTISDTTIWALNLCGRKTKDWLTTPGKLRSLRFLHNPGHQPFQVKKSTEYTDGTEKFILALDYLGQRNRIKELIIRRTIEGSDLNRISRQLPYLEVFDYHMDLPWPNDQFYSFSRNGPVAFRTFFHEYSLDRHWQPWQHDSPILSSLHHQVRIMAHLSPDLRKVLLGEGLADIDVNLDEKTIKIRMNVVGANETSIVTMAL